MMMAPKIKNSTHAGLPGLAHSTAISCHSTITRTTTTQYQSRGLESSRISSLFHSVVNTLPNTVCVVVGTGRPEVVTDKAPSLPG
jgi:hypothetical protein